jgi:hypothetical protein
VIDHARRVWWKVPASGCLASMLGSSAVFVLGWIFLALFGPNPAFPGDPNDGPGLALFGLAMVVGFLGFVGGVIVGIVRMRRRIRTQKENVSGAA